MPESRTSSIAMPRPYRAASSTDTPIKGTRQTSAVRPSGPNTGCDEIQARCVRAFDTARAGNVGDGDLGKAELSHHRSRGHVPLRGIEWDDDVAARVGVDEDNLVLDAGDRG